MALSKVTVVLSVYNVEKYLPECLESLLNQTLDKVEILCVDGGSTDNSSAILSEYAERYSIIKKIEKKDRYGEDDVSSLLKESCGEYVIFLNSSDVFHPELLKKTYEAGAGEHADIVLFGARDYGTDTDEAIDAPGYFRRELLPDKMVFSRKDIPNDIMSISSPDLWLKLFRRDFLFGEKLEIPLFQHANDIYISLVSMCVAGRITYVDEDLVYHRTGFRDNLVGENPQNCVWWLTAVYKELSSRGIFEEVEKNWTEMALAALESELTKVERPVDKIGLCGAIGSEEFLQTNIFDHSDEFYNSLNRKEKVEGALYALKWQNRMRKYLAENEGKAECLKKSIVTEKPLVSVVIPVYNVELYLEECLDSIVNQTLRQIEIICVNDGSADTSGDILMRYAQNDQRIAIYVQENRGQSAARNEGIRHANGEYLYFMDSDDILETNALELLYSKVKKNELDVIFFDGSSFSGPDKSNEVEGTYKKYYQREYTYPEICRGEELLCSFVQHGEYRVSPCLQMTKRSYFMDRNLFFYEGIYHEDNIYTFCCMLNTDRAGYVHEILFHRRVREQSTMTAQVSFAHVYGYFISFLQMNKFAERCLFTEAVGDAVNTLIYRVLHNARNKYMDLSLSEKCSFWGMEPYLQLLFNLYVVEPSDSIQRWKDYRQLLQQTYAEKSELNRKLQTAYAEKSELNKKLQVTYGEKSEINRKLQIAYTEKSERGLKIKTLENTIVQLENQNEQLKTEIETLKRTMGYKVRKIIGYLPEIIKRNMRKLGRGIKR
ncbi:MAG: glycosyltransferase [Eubacteriales bacterium]|nr:glycosyltransferase [Eubacteriales bacterium]